VIHGRRALWRYGATDRATELGKKLGSWQLGARQGGESSDGDGDGDGNGDGDSDGDGERNSDGDSDSDSDRRAKRVTGRLRCSGQRQRQRQKQKQMQMHALPAGRSRGWDLAELSLLTSWELGTGMSSISSQQAKLPDARRQTPDANSLRALKYVAPRYYFRHLQPPLAHAPTRTIPTRLTLAIATTSGSL
jgi:hypothetical protein